tara:strand:+ start:8850 stop:9404 length:555 start_codon:yes stop_codon:yes gene_type:complete
MNQILFYLHYKNISVVILAIVIIIILYNKSQYITQYSSINKQHYQVLNNNDSQEAADRLAISISNIDEFVKYLVKHKNNKWPTFNTCIERLGQRYPPEKITEGRDNCSSIRDKKKELVICLKDEHCKFTPLSRIRKILIHELAHIACVSNGHGSEFKNIHKFLQIESKHFFSKKNKVHIQSKHL